MLFRGIAFLILFAGGAAAQQPVSFDRDVRPLLAQRCAMCHGATGGAGGVSLTSYTGVAKVLASVPAVVSGEKPRMPKSGSPLTAAQVAMLTRWIAEGAKNDSVSDVWWSLRPLSKAAPPAGAANPIDAFVLAKLREKGLTPSPEADRRTLIRRLTYDLHGLPPSWEEIQAFVNDRQPDAYERLVDRLLASPRYGERWGRHWLDVVHYGESHGYDKDKARRTAWPYRDYIIRSFNEDKPYTRFVKEQLAGDVLFPGDPQGVVALGMIAAGPWDYVGNAELRDGTTDRKIARLLDGDDMVMTVMSGLASNTVHCARCHNHKFDPIPQEDYYSLQAVFAGVDRADRPYDDDPAVYQRRLPLLAERRAAMLSLRPFQDKKESTSTPEIEALSKQIQQLREENAEKPDEEKRKQADALGEKRKALVEAALDDATRKGIEEWTAKLADVDKRLAELPKPKLVYAAANTFDTIGTFRFAPGPRPVYLLARGNVDAPQNLVQPGALTAVSALPSRFQVDTDNEGARRAALAAWLTDPKNPLTWRSIANRIWHYHFGAGIVDSPNDFGHMGSLPTHPELLDWLAGQLIENGGSMKTLHRLIVTSATYKQTSANNAANAKTDADNRFLWRMNRARLDAESVRDSALAISGKLDLTMGGPSAEQFWFKDDHSPTYDYTKFDVDSPASYRRSVYRFVVRSVPDPLMDRLDCPDPSLMTGKRNITLTAIQALALLNNPLFVRQSEHLAERVQLLAQDLPGQIDWVFRLSLGRDPKAGEKAELATYAKQYGLANACRVMLNSNEFLFVD
jgi:cytochrome c553